MKTVIALSGGLDSAVLLHHATHVLKDDVILAVSFNYGSKHNPYENDAASRIASDYGIPWRLVTIPPVVFSDGGSALTDNAVSVPEGHYEEESMRKTVVPFRNGVMLSILTAIAEGLSAKFSDRVNVMIGAHAGDHFIYPDCRPAFMETMVGAIHHGTDGKVDLVAPFIFMDKTAIVGHGKKHGFNQWVSTRTCYAPQPVACGKCGACQERLAAFAANGMVDPISYVSREILPKKG